MVAKLFRALGDPSRLLLLAFISERSEARGNECVEKMGLSQGRVSQHLSCMVACGSLRARRDGRFTVYRVADERVSLLLQLGVSLTGDHLTSNAACVGAPH